MSIKPTKEQLNKDKAIWLAFINNGLLSDGFRQYCKDKAARIDELLLD